ncbi:MAG: hypothetical protein M3539_02740 [Acidobacteriota bacterium]|nr:hypothetical protein [Acidobacteriota bacterium]
MANKMDANQTNPAGRKLEYGETQPPRNDIKEQRGGPQTNQVTGETDKGAHNQDIKAETRKATSLIRGSTVSVTR